MGVNLGIGKTNIYLECFNASTRVKERSPLLKLKKKNTMIDEND